MKKILLSFGAIAAVLVAMPMFAAFEAHVINVTATIENALSVDTNSIKFGTVFPQEHFNRPLTIALAQSFIDEGRVDDVKYFIRQKPKCGITSNGGKTLDEANTATGHIIAASTTPGYVIDCGQPPRELVTGESWGVLPSLCEYLSKDPDSDVPNDGTTPAFHKPWTWDNASSTVVWNDTNGYLSKLAQDTTDNWNIDLAVPCFGGSCAQDWATFVQGINPNANPADYTQNIGNEHKVFGCDLWVEVSEVSQTPVD